MNTVLFRQILGSLIYLYTRTRPDIYTTVLLLGKYQSDPPMQGWKALKHLLRYLQGTIDYCVMFRVKFPETGLKVWTDADRARYESNRRSRSGTLLLYTGAPLSWMFKKKTATTMSTSEAEFSALASAVSETVCARSQLAELNSAPRSATAVYQDNLGGIIWTEDIQ